MKSFKQLLTALMSSAVILIFSLSSTAQAQVFDEPIIYETLPGFQGGDDEESFPGTLQVGEMDTSLINPISGEPLNEVVFAFNPLPPTIGPAGINFNVRFFTLYHTSETDTRALSLSAPADLIYPDDQDHIRFEASSSLQILDLDRDGQNDLAFNGFPDADDCEVFTCGPAPTLGALGTGADPFVTGEVDMIGRTLDQYNPPFPSFFGAALLGFSDFLQYTGMPTLASADLDGDAFTDLLINDWDFPDPAPAPAGVAGAGPMNAGQMLRAFVNNGSLGPLMPMDTMINIPPPLVDPFNAIPFYILSDDFDMDGTNDAAVIYVVEEVDNEASIRLMVFDGLGDGTFNATPRISNTVIDSLPGEGVVLTAFTYGDFEGNDHLDFAVSFITVDAMDVPTVQVGIVTCAPGMPPTCNNQNLVFATEFLPISLDAGDFDGDGLDDLVQLEFACPEGGGLDSCNVPPQGRVSAYLNQAGTFSTEADQIISPEVAPNAIFAPLQVIARDIDGCSPEDIAFTGLEIQPPQTDMNAGGQGIPLADVGRGGVAFATVDGVVAEAGVGIPLNGGVQIGGEPTCFDPDGNLFNIQWTQISGTPAIISDPTAANPIVTNLTTESTFEVTCQTACAVATDTVIISPAVAGICVSGSGHFWDTIRNGCAGCSLNRSSSGSAPIELGFLIMGLYFGLSLLKARSKKSDLG